MFIGNNTYLADADNWSRLGEDICFDLHFQDYLQFVQRLRATYPAPTDLPMLPQNMPYYRGLWGTMQPDSNHPDADATYYQSLFHPSFGATAGACLTFPMSLLGSVTLTPLLLPAFMLPLTTKFHAWLSRSCDSVGWYTPLVEDTSLQLSFLGILLFVSALRAISTHLGMLSSKNSHCVMQSLPVDLKCWTTFEGPGTAPRFMALFDPFPLLQGQQDYLQILASPGYHHCPIAGIA